MFWDQPLVAFWLAIVVQLAGLGCMLTTRLLQKSDWHAAAQALFFAALTGMGAAALGCVALQNGYGLAFGATLSFMAVGATLDLHRAPRAAF